MSQIWFASIAQQLSQDSPVFASQEDYREASMPARLSSIFMDSGIKTPVFRLAKVLSTEPSLQPHATNCKRMTASSSFKVCLIYTVPYHSWQFKQMVDKQGWVLNKGWDLSVGPCDGCLWLLPLLLLEIIKTQAVGYTCEGFSWLAHSRWEDPS